MNAKAGCLLVQNGCPLFPKEVGPAASTSVAVERPGGPYAATFEEKGSNYSINWSAKQMGGEKRAAPKLTPEMKRQLEQLRKMLASKR